MVAVVGDARRVNGNANDGSKDELEEEEEVEGMVDGESKGDVFGQEMPLRHRIHVG